MSMISQSGIKAAMQAANEAAANYSRTISTDTKSFCDSVGQIWACEYAKNFASVLKTAIEDITTNFTSNMGKFRELLDTCAANYQQANGGAKANVPEVEFEKSEADVSGIKEYLPESVTGTSDGQGMAPGHSTSEVEDKLSDLIKNISTAKTNAVEAIKTSAAFDEDEVNAISNTFGTVGDILEEDLTKLNTEVKSYLEDTEKKYSETKNTNMENAQSTSAG